MTHSTFDISDFQYLQAFRQLLPRRLLQQAVRSACHVRTRLRCLPAYLVLSTLVAWFFYAPAKLPFIVGWLCRQPKRLPSDSALYQARARLGWGPLRWLCRRVLRPLADPARDPSAFYDGWRLLAVDGTTFTVADTPANERTFGRASNQHGGSGYPLMRLVALCEVGTHALLRWITRSFRVGEQTLAARLWPQVPPGALLLADCNFSQRLSSSKKHLLNFKALGSRRAARLSKTCSVIDLRLLRLLPQHLKHLPVEAVLALVLGLFLGDELGAFFVQVDRFLAQVNTFLLDFF